MKKVILYKFGRFQEDFEYAFKNVKVVKYITDDKTVTSYNRKECIHTKDVNTKLKYMIVICSERNKYTINTLTKQGLKEDIHFMFLEDYVKTLDEEIPLRIAKKIEKFRQKYNIDINYKESSISEMFIKMMKTEPIYSFNCNSPFTYAQIQPDGSVYPCCPSKATESIGNIYHGTPKKVWNSTRARIYRLSIINKTYAFCNLNNCSLSNTSYKNGRERAQEPKLPKVPEQLALAFDDSCNLKCKMCRKCIVDNSNDKIQNGISKNIYKKISKAKWFNRTKNLVIGSQGEPFYSKIYQNIIFKKRLKGIENISIHTNGLLLTPKVVDKIYNRFKDTYIGINVSIDSLDNKTYKKIRNNSSLNTLKENLEYLAQAKRDQRIRWVCLVIILQKDNYEELPDLIKYAIELGIDFVDITKIVNWGTYTYEEFKEISMYDEKGKPKPELAKILKDPIFKSDEINIIGNVIKGN